MLRSMGFDGDGGFFATQHIVFIDIYVKTKPLFTQWQKRG
jgi:hypothetical protein